MGCSGLSVLGRISFWKVEVFTEGGETRRELALERPHEPIDDALWDAGPLFHNADFLGLFRSQCFIFCP